jgi:hypothetical protein
VWGTRVNLSTVRNACDMPEIGAVCAHLLVRCAEEESRLP